jgi:cytochrome c
MPHRLPALSALIALASLSAPLAEAQESGDADRGAEIFSGECRACHSSSLGPNLRGVVGRPIASKSDFPGYSEALKAHAAGSWTPERLDSFLTSTSDFAPGTLMVKVVADPQTRADLIAYLASLPPPAE